MIGFVECECIIYDASSLKEKRAVLKRVITRIRAKFNVSVSEIDYQDTWQRTSFGIAAVSSSRVQTEKELQRVLSFIDSFPEIERTITRTEWF
ncbi:DUF503 domain-containing protein [Bacillus paralicheniformis]|uniref:DUF503 domain-containing protein n=2 Tax=Bacillus TaxID=1386 RepID=A0AA90FAM3_9BACI|nr:MULTISPECIES: DUF503 domain-containing protein [Bacillus]ETB69697.1 hypothetical protein A943_17215 [Bacillus sp. CPSM8]KJD53136.1 hypothetical protein UZ38_34145 [Bacillus amyloliquefaciens]KUL07542.1 hypothetical protein LI7559_17275 [Bacillus licheniformis LMG 7559]KUL19293.1 hypothetical protein LI6934_01385 [Bacillus licheniformis LMG 6934]MBC8622671.1 DUF503 domain-containing protein [Robertmurraya crescens]MCD2369259.1 DUF503 domain-containing protein [Bacillus sp. BS3(2021)]MCJ214